MNLTDLAIVLANFGINCGVSGFGGGEGLMSGPSNEEAALRDWLLSATLEQIMEWYHAGMPPIGANEY